MCFQLVDDVLDLAADAETLGKPTGNDLHEGVYTLPVILAAAERPELAGLLGGSFDWPDVERAKPRSWSAPARSRRPWTSPAPTHGPRRPRSTGATIWTVPCARNSPGSSRTSSLAPAEPRRSTACQAWPVGDVPIAPLIADDSTRSPRGRRRRVVVASAFVVVIAIGAVVVTVTHRADTLGAGRRDPHGRRGHQQDRGTVRIHLMFESAEPNGETTVIDGDGVADLAHRAGSVTFVLPAALNEQAPTYGPTTDTELFVGTHLYLDAKAFRASMLSLSGNGLGPGSIAPPLSSKIKWVDISALTKSLPRSSDSATVRPKRQFQ